MDMLVLADRDGVVDMTLDAISRRTNVPEEMVKHAITELMKPDRKSRSHQVDGCRLVALDSHRDWGWQIVNYEHYRNIKDEEARRTYFRDKQRAHRAKGVKDSQTQSKEITQGDLEGDLSSPPARAKMPKSAGGDGELMAAVWLLGEIGLAGGTSDVQIIGQVIFYAARDAKTDVQTAAEFLVQSAKAAMERGETVNTFWFKDRKFIQEPNNGRSGKGKPSAAKQRVDANRRAIAEALAERGVEGPWSGAGEDGPAVSESGYDGRPAGVHEGLRESGPEILPPERDGGNRGAKGRA
jgi:hypothetical protein